MPCCNSQPGGQGGTSTFGALKLRRAPAELGVGHGDADGAMCSALLFFCADNGLADGPDALAKRPAKQSSHAGWPAASCTVPALQSVGSSAPVFAKFAGARLAQAGQG